MQKARSSGLRLGQIQAGQLLARMFALCLLHEASPGSAAARGVRSHVILKRLSCDKKPKRENGGGCRMCGCGRLPAARKYVTVRTCNCSIYTTCCQFYMRQVKLESKFASVVLAIAVLEGVGRSLDPDCNILQAALPVVARASTIPIGMPTD